MPVIVSIEAGSGVTIQSSALATANGRNANPSNPPAAAPILRVVRRRLTMEVAWPTAKRTRPSKNEVLEILSRFSIACLPIYSILQVIPGW
jgi:hypothetical protein